MFFSFCILVSNRLQNQYLGRRLLSQSWQFTYWSKKSFRLVGKYRYRDMRPYIPYITSIKES